MKQIFTLILVALLTYGSFAQYNANLCVGGNQERNGLSEFLGPLDNPETYWSGGEHAQYAQNIVLEGELLIVGRRTASDHLHSAHIIAYNVYTGVELWRTFLPASPTSDAYEKVSAIKDDVVYATRANGSSKPAKLVALDASDGNVLWESEDDLIETFKESINFNSDGDIIVGRTSTIICIDKTNGTTKWVLDKLLGFGGDTYSVVVHGNKGYYWDRDGNDYANLVVSVCDLATGDSLYCSPTITIADNAQNSQSFQSGFMAGPDGTIYATRADSFIVSLTDNGTTLVENWRTPIGNFLMGNCAVGPDGSVYTFSPNSELIRLDPSDGSILNSTSALAATSVSLSPDMAIGSDGVVYLSLEYNVDYLLAFYNPDLTEIWSESAGYSGDDLSGLRGIALGDSVMVVNAKDNLIRAYKGRALSSININDPISSNNISKIYPNPTSGKFTVKGKGDFNNIKITDVTGKVIDAKLNTFVGETEVDITKYPAGIYFLKIDSETYRIIKMVY